MPLTTLVWHGEATKGDSFPASEGGMGILPGP